MRVLSLGAGVQSSTLLLMGCEGEERIDAAVFADTGWEPRAVYEHLAYLEERARAAGIPVYRVSEGNLREDALEASRRSASMPLHIANQDGTKGQLRRQCTSEYKIKPIRRLLRSMGVTRGQPADLLIGISLDECHRMRDSGVQYLRNTYPLIDHAMTRQDCLTWLRRRGYPTPPKSSCIGCPFHGDAYWRELREGSAEEWADAVAFDGAVRRMTRIDGEAYLHASLRPLGEVDLRSPQERGQIDLFGEECWGVCGV